MGHEKPPIKEEKNIISRPFESLQVSETQKPPALPETDQRNYIVDNEVIVY